MRWKDDRIPARVAGALAGAAALATLVGCNADFAVDLVNKTPQPVFAQIIRKGGSSSMLGASARLGPGDRGGLGPVRTEKDYGAYLTVDTLGNPGRPVTMDLLPGALFVEIHQDGEGPNSPLRLVEKH